MAVSAHEGFTIWFTGMSGAGKSTLANYIGARLVAAGKKVEILDGDDAGQLLGYELGETRDERDLSSRRVGLVAQLLSRNGVVAIGATVSPYRIIREELRRDIGRFVEVFTDCNVETLIQRDVKGLYKRALSGELPHFIGITEPYEPPASPEVTVDSANEAVQDAAERVIESLHGLGYLSADELKVALFGKAKEARAARRRAAKKAETAARAVALASAPEARRKAAGGASSKTSGGSKSFKNEQATPVKARPAKAAAAANEDARKPAQPEAKDAKAARSTTAAKSSKTTKAAKSSKTTKTGGKKKAAPKKGAPSKAAAPSKKAKAKPKKPAAAKGAKTGKAAATKQAGAKRLGTKKKPAKRADKAEVKKRSTSAAKSVSPKSASSKK